MTQDIPSEYFNGSNGLPVIRSDITINGNPVGGQQPTIQRTGATFFRIFAVQSTGRLTLNQVILQNGRIVGIGGGAIFSQFGTVHVMDSVITANYAETSSQGFQTLGGGIYNSGGTLTVENSTISNNQNVGSASDGGGIAILSSTTLTVLTNVTIQNNTAGRNGGGLWVDFNNGGVKVRSSTITGNQATGNGGGVYLGAHNVFIPESLLQNNAGGAQSDGVVGSGNAVFSRFYFNAVPSLYNDCIEQNTSTSALKSVSVVAYTNSQVRATSTWWNDAHGPKQATSNPTGLGDSVSDGVIYDSFDFTAPSNCLNPNVVATEAQPFYDHAAQFGLPAPFGRLPYNIYQLNQPDDPLKALDPNLALRVAIQGFGPSVWAFNKGNQLYNLTFQIHSGVDYGPGPAWVWRVAVSICDGVVIPGNWWIAMGPYAGHQTNGSAQPGRGVSVRCFMDSLVQRQD